MTDIITLALSKLDARSDERAQDLHRRGHRGAGSKHSSRDGYRLLQNLVVRKGDKKGRYFVVAGGRRLTAFQAVGGGGRDRHGD
ncbi:ParB N-terminal domain-containing protein [Sinorhizobium meliloti]|uniref:ParB N-terminal domain-containing protein n=1 Tax=Rhizobium meliloti TaxID=382 RepID=UPI001F319B20|nr:ParB N-terminal domain-containing protein [Sinorhizobium meliloti]